jgi:protein gp37
MEYSKIEWTDHTFNPWIGCQHVSPGCDHCYAEAQNNFRKWNGGSWGPHAPRKRTSASNWKNPTRWNRKARETGTRLRVFCASLADIWDNQAPTERRRDLFQLIAATPDLDWQLLTKRPENIPKMLQDATAGLKPWPWPNVWLGTTCEDQKYYDYRWPILSKIPAALHFVSYEPALGPLVLPAGSRHPDWIICGGESGPRARMMDSQWALDLLHDCQLENVPFFMKQMTKKKPIPPALLVRQFPKTSSPHATKSAA